MYALTCDNEASPRDAGHVTEGSDPPIRYKRRRAGVSLPSNEEWRPIPDYEGTYEVSDQGRVRRLNFRHRGVQVLRLRLSTGGYLRLALWRDGVRKDVRVNRLVATVFLRPPVADEVCRHLNGDKTDNRLSNLAWGSPADNAADMLRMRRHFNSNKTHCRQGHPLDSTRSRGDGTDRRTRICSACNRERLREQYRSLRRTP